MRAHLSKRVVSKMSRKRKEERTENARLWVETWSEDAQAWFYYNAVTGRYGGGLGGHRDTCMKAEMSAPNTCIPPPSSPSAVVFFLYYGVSSTTPGEALWQPPRTGYTKHDGKLVLTSGEVLEDPLSGEVNSMSKSRDSNIPHNAVAC